MKREIISLVAIVVSITAIVFAAYSFEKSYEEWQKDWYHKMGYYTKEEAELNERTVFNELMKKYNNTDTQVIKYGFVIFVYHNCTEEEWYQWIISLPKEKRGEYAIKSTKVEQIKGVPIEHHWIIEQVWK